MYCGQDEENLLWGSSVGFWSPSSHGILSGHRAMISLGDILERFSARRPCPQPFYKVKTIFTLCPETLTLECMLSHSVMSDYLDPHGLQSGSFFCPWGFPGQNPGVGCHFLLQQILLTQGSNPHLQHWQADSLPLSYQGSPVS